MFPKNFLPRWLTAEECKPALITGLALFLVSFLLDLVLSWLGIPSEDTLLNDVTIGLLGAGLLIFFLNSLNLEQGYKRAKERMILVAELNHRIRRALVTVECSCLLDNKAERTLRVSEAMERIDCVLMEMVPSVATARSPRYFQPGQH